jgi:hypothetical protein
MNKYIVIMYLIIKPIEERDPHSVIMQQTIPFILLQKEIHCKPKNRPGNHIRVISGVLPMKKKNMWKRKQ